MRELMPIILILILSTISSKIIDIEVEYDENLDDLQNIQVFKLNEKVYIKDGKFQNTFAAINNGIIINTNNTNNDIGNTITNIFLSNSLHSKLRKSISLVTFNYNNDPDPHGDPAELTTTEFWIYISVIVFLTIFSCITSGLTVGYMSIDDLVLELKSKTGSPMEKHYASRILPIVSDRHLLLVTLLIWMAGSMESLPIFLSKFNL